MNITFADIEDFENLSPVSSDSLEDGFAEIYEPIIKQATDFIEKKLTDKYLDKGKICTILFEQYIRILTLYFSDLICDGHVERLQKYTVLTRTESLQEEDWLIHRGRLEYMIKLGKLWLRDKMNADEFSKEFNMRLSK